MLHANVENLLTLLQLGHYHANLSTLGTNKALNELSRSSQGLNNFSRPSIIWSLVCLEYFYSLQHSTDSIRYYKLTVSTVL